MTIEHSTVPPSAGHATARSQATGHAGRGGSGTAGAASLADGFSALLLGLGDAASDAVSAVASSAGISVGDDTRAADAAVDPGSAAASATQALLAQWLGLAANQGGGSPVATGTAATQADPALVPQTYVDGNGATAPGLTGRVGVESAAAQSMHSGVGSRAGLADAAEVATLADDLSPTRLGGKARGARALTGKGEAAGQGQRGQDALQAAQETQAHIAARGALADKVLTESASSPLTRSAEVFAMPGVVSELAQADVTGSGRRRERAAASVDTFRAEAWGPQGMGFTSFEPGAPGIMPAGATASALPIDVGVAEQVKYWIANDIQSAELKLDGLGGDAVQVNISMSGNEAQVVFRSDQAHTRELLGGAVAQLDQMLRDQGLSLSAAWVGGSGPQGGQASPQQRAAPAQQDLTADGASSPRPMGSVRVVATDRVVDFFV